MHPRYEVPTRVKDLNPSNNCLRYLRVFEKVPPDLTLMVTRIRFSDHFILPWFHSFSHSSHQSHLHSPKAFRAAVFELQAS